MILSLRSPATHGCWTAAPGSKRGSRVGTFKGTRGGSTCIHAPCARTSMWAGFLAMFLAEAIIVSLLVLNGCPKLWILKYFYTSQLISQKFSGLQHLFGDTVSRPKDTSRSPQIEMSYQPSLDSSLPKVFSSFNLRSFGSSDFAWGLEIWEMKAAESELRKALGDPHSCRIH